MRKQQNGLGAFMFSLRESEEKYRIMAELIQETIIILDKDGKIIETNRQLRNWLGYDEEEIIGKNILSLPLLTDQAKNLIQGKIFPTTNSTNVLCWEMNFLSKSKEEKIGKVKIHQIRDDNGNIFKHFIVIDDITEQRRLEKAVLETTEREVQAYHQGRLEIIDNVLHNVGNAINSITVGIGTIQEKIGNTKFNRYFTSLAEAIKEHQSDFSDYVKNDPQGQKVAPFIVALARDLEIQNEELSKTAQRISDRAKHIGDIIQMDRAFGRPEHTQNCVNIRRLIYAVANTFKNTIEGKKIRIVTDCDSAPYYIDLPEEQIYDVIMELISKSIDAIDKLKSISKVKYMPFIKIACYSEYDFIILEATHNGIGIDKCKLETIFKDNKESSEDDLNIDSTIDIVNRYGGKIQILSGGEHEGATMRILLPFSSSYHTNTTASFVPS